MMFLNVLSDLSSLFGDVLYKHSPYYKNFGPYYKKDPLNMVLIKPLIGLPVLGRKDSGPSAFYPFVFLSATKYQHNWIGIKWTESFFFFY